MWQHSSSTCIWVYISLLIRYSRACGSYQDFLDRGLMLTRKLPNQGFLLDKLKSSLRKFYGRHHDLVDRYGISVSQMTTDMFHLSWTLTYRFFPHSWLITGFVTRLKRRVSSVEQELLTLPERHEFTPVRVTRSLVLSVCFVDRCLSFILFLLVIVLSVLLRYTDSDYPFGIFKLFLSYLIYAISLLSSNYDLRSERWIG